MFALVVLASLSFISPGHGQMRKVFKDDLTPDNDIRKISFYSPSSGYVAFRDWIGFTTDSGRTFTRKFITLSNVNYNGYAVNVTFGFGISGVQAFDQNTIIAYGDYGLVPAILRSTDGGNSFLLVYHSQFSPTQLRTGVMDMVFPGNGNTGVAVDADRILRSTDKGITWTVSYTNPNRYFSRLEAVDNNTVFAVSTRYSPAVFYKSLDAGASWTPALAPAGDLNSLSFFTAAKGWANVDEKIFYTSNGGLNWVQKNHTSVTPFTADKMRFVNDYTGYALSGLYKVYKTTDSGRIWEPVARDNNYTYLGHTHNDLQVWSNDQLWAGGDHGFLELNTNGSAAPLPAAYFQIDTAGMWVANLVQLKNYSKSNYTYQWIVNGVTVGSSYHASYVHDIYLTTDTVKLIVSNGSHTDTTEKIHYFNAVPYPPPLVNTFLPTSGGAGTQVTITGNFFANVTGVYFGGIPASSYTVQSLTKIVAVVGAGGNGNVSVTSATGTGFLPGFITYPPPVITSLSPVFAPVGATVTITGSNFGATPAENIVFFGGVRATVLTAGPGQLTVQVPAGAPYAPVFVTVNNHTASSLQRFSVTFPAACGFTEFTFDKPKGFPGSSNSLAATMSITDLDGDGKSDVAVPSFNGTFILHNKSTPGFIDFQKVLTYDSVQAAVTGAGVADLDGDGKPDLVTVNNWYNKLVIYKNTSSIGSISFDDPIIFPVTGGPAGVVFHDLDGDGKQEMIVTNEAANFNYLSVYRNISLPGHIAFEPKLEVTVGREDNKVSIGDLDGDGKPDLFVGDNGIFNSGLYSFTILRNTSSMGNISFAQSVVQHHTFSYKDGELADMDGDGKLDIVTVYDVRYTTGNKQAIAIHKNNSTPGNMSFAPPVPFNACLDNGTVALGDLDGDGKLDLLSSCGFSSQVTLLKNTGSPGNISMVSVNSPYIIMSGGSNNAAIADLDNDTRPDIISAGSQFFNVFRNILEPGALAGKDTTICAGQSVKLGHLDAADHTYAWTSSEPGFSSALANPIVNPAVSTDYYIAVTNPSGCVAKDTIHVTVGAPALLVNAGTDALICMGSSRQIGMTGDASHTYSWISIPAGFTSTIPDPVVTPSYLQTNYILTVNTGSCIARDTVTINLASLPEAQAGPDQHVCLSNGASIGRAATGSNTYSWTSNPAGYTSNLAMPTVYPTVPTTYYLEVTSPHGCKAFDTVQTQVYVSPPVPTVTASGPLIFCEGGSVVLTSSAATDNQWYNNGLIMQDSTKPFIIVTKSGSYVVRNVNGFCYSGSVPVLVTVNATPPAPQITVSGNTSICQGGSVLLTSSATQGNQWYKNGVAIAGAVSKNLTVTEAGQYTLLYTSAANGCLSHASGPITVVVTPAPELPVITQAGNNLVSSAAMGNQWYLNGTAIPGAVNSTWQPVTPGTYTVSVTKPGCPSVTSAPFNYTITAINEPVWSNSMIVSPNPTQGDVEIRYTGNSTRFTAMVLDLNGRQVKSQGLFRSSCILDFRKLSAGMYVIRIFNVTTSEYINRVIVKQ
jgi:hypothetical protein